MAFEAWVLNTGRHEVLLRLHAARTRNLHWSHADEEVYTKLSTKLSHAMNLYEPLGSLRFVNAHLRRGVLSIRTTEQVGFSFCLRNRGKGGAHDMG